MNEDEQNTIACGSSGELPQAAACIVVIHGDGFGQRVDIGDAPVVVGRANTADLQLPSPSVSRRHCEIRREGDAYLIRDLGSTNATFIGGRRIDETPLADGDQITVGESVLKFISHTNVEAVYHARVSRLIVRDQLTGFLGRQDFVDAAEKRIAASLSSGAPLSLAVLDVDDAANLQLEYGDDACDAVLAYVAELVRDEMQPDDLAARIGGCRLAILLAGRDLAAAQAFVNTLEAKLVSPPDLPSYPRMPVSIHGGTAHLQPGTSSLGQLIKQIRIATPGAA